MERAHFIENASSVSIPHPGSRRELCRKRRDLIEIGVLYPVVLLVFWTPQPWQDLLRCVAAALILETVLNSPETLRALVPGRGNPLWSACAVGGSVAVAVVAVLLSLGLHTLQLPDSPASLLRNSFEYTLWATIQQVVLQCVFLSRLVHILGDRTKAVACAAALFAAAHLPSPFLVSVTFLCGMAACFFFLRHRSLFPLVIAHAVLGLAIAYTVPSSLDHDMRVGLAYETWSQQPAHFSPAFKAAKLSQPQAPDRVN
jgi:membrane protease YdiL (CAAX protease family)